ncbi:GntR family transcriptional regulator [Caldifermentibacillus hisashii]|uniref:GntR family transcriptional regulator n=1 Tax=Caldifermentibacillus hisashii TaxID=996558 RepID=A0ABU9JWX6_9BACI
MEFNSNLPIYIQIMNLIKTKIASGELNGGDKLPSVREFSKEMKVNPNTIQRVYQELEREKLVFTQRGMGTFVTEKVEIIKNLKRDRAAELMNQFFLDMESLGFGIDEIKKMVSEWTNKEESV